jgi:hypothetical protein
VVASRRLSRIRSHTWSLQGYAYARTSKEHGALEILTTVEEIADAVVQLIGDETLAG